MINRSMLFTGFVRTISLSAFYLVPFIAKYGFGRDEFSVKILVFYTNSIFLTNLLVTWIEQAYQKYKDDQYHKSVLVYFSAACFVVLAIALYFPIPGFSALEYLILALFIISECIQRYLSIVFITKNQDQFFISLNMLKIFTDLIVALAFLSLALSSESFIYLFFVSALGRLLLAVIFFSIGNFHLDTQHLTSISISWLKYGIPISIFALLIQLYPTVVQNLIPASSKYDTQTIFFQRYSFQIGTVFAGIFLGRMTPIIFQNFSTVNSKAFFKVSFQYTAINFIVNSVLLGIFYFIFAKDYTKSHFLVLFISTTSFAFSSMAQKTFEMNGKSYMLPISAAVSIAIVFIISSFFSGSTKILIELSFVYIVYYLTISVSGLVSTASLHTTFHVALSASLFLLSILMVKNVIY
jgi:hypothetical protein